MPFRPRHVDAGSLVGSWPILPAAVAGSPTILPRTILSKATILGVVREPAGGYDVDGRSFNLNVDGDDFSIAFTYSGLLPLSEVISQINTEVGSTVAFSDNGFLKLQSPTIGEGSYLKITVDPSSSPTDVLYNLGLFAEIESYAGDLVQAQNPDPDRQVALPGQMTMSEGENLEPRVVNRALMQLALNNDRNEGQLSKKRLAVRTSVDIGSYSKPGTVDGYQFSGSKLVYLGKSTAPSIADLAKMFVLLDSEGRELTHQVAVPVATGYTATFSTVDDTTGRQLVVSAYIGTLGSEAAADKGNLYIVSSAFTGGAAVLNGKLLKITEVNIATNTGYIDNINPATGAAVPISQAGVAVTFASSVRNKVVVDGVYSSLANAQTGTNRLENVATVKRNDIVPTRVDKNNRVVFEGENFTTSAAIQVGDLLVWASSAITSPFNNNGTYRVSKIIDKETLELVGSDWGAVFLNADLTSASPGTCDVTTDGAFALDPFIRFSAGTSYAQPVSGDAIRVLFMKGMSFRDATDEDPSLISGDLEFANEADETTARAIMRLWGPSATSMDDVLYGDYRINLESLNTRLNREHYTYDQDFPGQAGADSGWYGRHKDIRPDTVDMWQTNSNTARVIVRGNADSSSPANDYPVFDVRDASDRRVLTLTSRGRIANIDDLDSTRALINLYWDATARYRLGASSFGAGAQSGLKLENALTSLSGDYQIRMAHLKQTINNTLTSSANGIGNTFTGEAVTFLKMEEVIPATHRYGLIWDKFRFLHLNMQYSSPNTVDSGFNYVHSIYGMDITHTIGASARISGDHVGLFIDDIVRAGTGTGSEGASQVNLLGTGTANARNYAIYSKAGKIRLGDDILVKNGKSLLPEISGTDSFTIGATGNRINKAWLTGLDATTADLATGNVTTGNVTTLNVTNAANLAAGAKFKTSGNGSEVVTGYRTGTYVPTFHIDGGSITVNSSTARFARIGKMVTVSVSFQLTFNVPTGSFWVVGLIPYDPEIPMTVPAYGIISNGATVSTIGAGQPWYIELSKAVAGVQASLMELSVPPYRVYPGDTSSYLQNTTNIALQFTTSYVTNESF